MRLTSGGDKGHRGGPFGDLYVIIHVREDKTFVRDGETIHIRQPISFSMAGLGGEMLVPSVDGKRPLRIPAGIQSGTTLVMRDLGVPRFNSPVGKRGDQIVHVIVDTPRKPSDEERALLQQLATVRGENLDLTKEERDAWEAEQEKLAANGKEAKAPVEKSSKKGAKAKAGKSDEQVKEESILDKLGDFFRPKNGEHDDK